MIDITVEELNKAYNDVIEIGKETKQSSISYVLSRDPLTMHNLTTLYKDKVLPLCVTLEFNFEYSLGRKGSYICVSDINVLDID